MLLLEYWCSLCVSQYKALSETNLSGGDRKRMREVRRISTRQLRKIFSPNVYKNRVLNDYKQSIRICFCFSVIAQSTRIKIYSNQCEICSCQRRKMRLGKRIRKERVRLVLVITHSGREDGTHLLMD